MAGISLQPVDTATVFFDGSTYSYRDIIRAIPGSNWNRKAKRWELPIESVQDAVRILPTIGIAPDVKKGFEALATRQAQAIAVKAVDESTVSGEVAGLKGTLYPYQAVGLEFLRYIGAGQGAILAFDMGLGKSLTALAYGLELKNKGIIDHILVVCPAKLKYATWAQEIQKWTDMSYVVIDGDKPEVVEWEDGTTERLSGRRLREVQYQQADFGVDVIVMNYELFQYDVEQEDNITWVKEFALKKAERAELTAFIEGWADANSLAVDTGDSTFWQNATRAFLAERDYDTSIYELRSPKRPYLVRKEDASHRILPDITDRWLVIMDESHRIKSPQALTTKNLIKNLKPAGRKVLATGTPMENNIQELWTLVDFCRPNMLGTYYKFLQRYVEMDFFGSPVAPKPQMLPELIDKLDPVMIRKSKKDALPDLPPLTVVNRWVDMTPVQRKLYKQVKEGILEIQREMGNEFTYLEALAQLTRIQQLVDSPALLRPVLEDETLPLESGKLTELASILSEIKPADNQFILFSQYSQMTDLLFNWLVEQGIVKRAEIGYVKGGIKSSDIERVRAGFEAGHIRCVLMTTAGNYGLNLQSASYVICFDQLFNPQQMEQIYARAHRNGATHNITAINLITADSYEENKMEILEAKRDLFKAVIETDADVLKKLFASPSDLINLI
jgi:SNF2 family DNA or RNA helicase